MKTAYAAASLAAFLLAPALTADAFADPREYAFDKTHTTIRATWDHLGLSFQSLHFTDFDGVLLLDFDSPENSTVDVTFNLEGGYWVGPDQGRFEAHLASDDLFHVAEHPTARFVGTRFETEDGETGLMTGDLTLLGQTHPVTLEVTLNQRGPHPMGGHEVAGFSATGVIQRSQWGMGFAVPAVSDDIRIDIETELSLVTADE
ncbi:polyisoprenoid-binding protein [Alkalicaulis satelles]|uniref:Polyisoprenoid-binding protein n=1 Tax=Alkalicaulis satelles TaxID=2609175 RepID=A0A5M6ZGQ4_9PROT|nr:YceI family protein [Alkalicaulis satelles]KAA5803909.1 polyisoprenoid-binding protein [Alkalicaulis satelles]